MFKSVWSKFEIIIHNRFFVDEHSRTLIIGDKPNSNAGTNFCGYLRFKRALDKKTGKLRIPGKIKQIKLDIGLSFAAPNSAMWLENLPDRIVFGFEPNPENVNEILTGNNIKRGKQYHYVDLKFINKRFFVFNTAIDNSLPGYTEFYMTEGDPGTSSLYKPNIFKIKKKIMIPSIPLTSFFSLIPWQRFKYIEHIKVDTQGNDLRVLQSAGKFLKRRVVFVTAESTAKGYNHTHTGSQLDRFMKKNGFSVIADTDKGGNKTYLNNLYKNISGDLDYSTENK